MVQRYVKNQGHENAGRELQASRAVPGKRTIPGLRVMKGLEHDVCRQEIVILSGLPINHITRIIRDLLDAGMIRVTRLGRSPLTGRLVGMLAVVDKEKE